MSEERGRREGERESGSMRRERARGREKEREGEMIAKKLITGSLWGGGDHLNPSVTISTTPPVKKECARANRSVFE